MPWQRHSGRGKTANRSPLAGLAGSPRLFGKERRISYIVDGKLSVAPAPAKAEHWRPKMVEQNMIEGEALALAAATYADEKQAEDISVLDLRGISSIADYFVVCTGGSTPHLKAIRREVDEKIAIEHGVKPRAIDGNPESQWLVIDYVDVIVHIFHKDRRDSYSLEDLWSDAQRVAFESSNPVAPNSEPPA